MSSLLWLQLRRELGRAIRKGAAKVDYLRLITGHKQEASSENYATRFASQQRRFKVVSSLIEYWSKNLSSDLSGVTASQLQADIAVKQWSLPRTSLEGARCRPQWRARVRRFPWPHARRRPQLKTRGGRRIHRLCRDPLLHPKILASHAINAAQPTNIRSPFRSTSLS